MFPGFTDKDFEAYAPNKWRSNAFTRERLEVKQKLDQLSALIAPRLHCHDGTPLLCEASAEHPALWNQKQVDSQQLYFSRNEASRRELDAILTRSRTLASLIEDPSPQRSHLFLSVHLSHSQVLVGMRLHTDATVDRHNLEKKIADHWLRDRFLDLLSNLDDSVVVTLGRTPHGPAARLDADSLAALLIQLAKPLAANQSRWLTIATTLGRDEAIAMGPELAQPVCENLAALLPVYQFIAWSRDNDHISIRDQLEQQTAKKHKRGLVANDRVRITAGMFAGRDGVVREVSDKGVVRVQVGNLPVVVTAEQLEKR